MKIEKGSAVQSFGDLVNIVRMSDGTLWEGQIALYFRWTCLPDGAVPELAAGSRRDDR